MEVACKEMIFLLIDFCWVAAVQKVVGAVQEGFKWFWGYFEGKDFSELIVNDQNCRSFLFIGDIGGIGGIDVTLSWWCWDFDYDCDDYIN